MKFAGNRWNWKILHWMRSSRIRRTIFPILFYVGIWDSNFYICVFRCEWMYAQARKLKDMRGEHKEAYLDTLSCSEHSTRKSVPISKVDLVDFLRTVCCEISYSHTLQSYCSKCTSDLLFRKARQSCYSLVKEITKGEKHIGQKGRELTNDLIHIHNEGTGTWLHVFLYTYTMKGLELDYVCPCTHIQWNKHVYLMNVQNILMWSYSVQWSHRTS